MQIKNSKKIYELPTFGRTPGRSPRRIQRRSPALPSISSPPRVSPANSPPRRGGLSPGVRARPKLGNFTFTVARLQKVADLAHAAEKIPSRLILPRDTGAAEAMVLHWKTDMIEIHKKDHLEMIREEKRAADARREKKQNAATVDASARPFSWSNGEPENLRLLPTIRPVRRTPQTDAVPESSGLGLTSNQAGNKTGSQTGGGSGSQTGTNNTTQPGNVAPASTNTTAPTPAPTLTKCNHANSAGCYCANMVQATGALCDRCEGKGPGPACLVHATTQGVTPTPAQSISQPKKTFKCLHSGHPGCECGQVMDELGICRVCSGGEGRPPCKVQLTLASKYGVTVN